jgi:hypothetical protein
MSKGELLGHVDCTITRREMRAKQHENMHLHMYINCAEQYNQT